MKVQVDDKDGLMTISCEGVLSKALPGIQNCCRDLNRRTPWTRLVFLLKILIISGILKLSWTGFEVFRSNCPFLSFPIVEKL